MKKILLVIAIFLAFSLVACNNGTKDPINGDDIVNNSNSVIENVEFSTDLEGVYNTIISEQPEEKKEELHLFLETNEELINSYYVGLADIDLVEKNIYMHPVGYACEIALVKVNDISDIENVKNVFNARIQKGIEVAMCDSESQDIWKRRAEIQTRDKYACLIVLPDEYNIPKDIFSLEIVNNETEINEEYVTKYQEKLNLLPVEDLYSEYALYDLDKDEIPEMIVKTGDSEANTKIKIYDIIDNVLEEVSIDGFGGHTNIVGAIDINSIILQYGQMDYEKVAVLHYNQDGSYTLEIVKESEVNPEIGYIPFESLKMYSFEDKEGLSWTENPDDENYWYINAGNSEV